MKSLTQSMLGAGTRNWRFTLSSGQGAFLSELVVLCGFPRTNALNAPVFHQPRDRAADNVETLAAQMMPDLAYAVRAFTDACAKGKSNPARFGEKSRAAGLHLLLSANQGIYGESVMPSAF